MICIYSNTRVNYSLAYNNVVVYTANMKNFTTELTRAQVMKAMLAANIEGTVSGRGKKWEVELPNETAKRRFNVRVARVGGYKTGYGSWIMMPGYVAYRFDFCNVACEMHY